MNYFICVYINVCIFYNWLIVCVFNCRISCLYLYIIVSVCIIICIMVNWIISKLFNFILNRDIMWLEIVFIYIEEIYVWCMRYNIKDIFNKLGKVIWILIIVRFFEEKNNDCGFLFF